MGFYRKKPVVIEAFQLTEARRTDNSEWPQWLNMAWNGERGEEGSLWPREEGTSKGMLEVGTLEGKHLVSWDDFIIKGVNGELYPCKPDIFEKSYEEVEAPS